MNTFLAQLNNRLIKWENLYGYWYNECYDENGQLKKFDSQWDEEQYFRALHDSLLAMTVLKDLKRNMYYKPKKKVKREYKIGD